MIVEDVEVEVSIWHRKGETWGERTLIVDVLSRYYERSSMAWNQQMSEAIEH